MAILGSALVVAWPGAFASGYPGVLSSYWQRTLGIGSSEIGNRLFFTLVALGVIMFPVGKLQERVGTRLVIRVSVQLCSLATLMVAYATKVYMVYAWAFLAGTGSSFIFTPALTTGQRWWPERRGLVSGIVNLVFGLSADVMSPLFRIMLDRLGYTRMNVLVAAVALVWGLALSILTEVPERSERRADQGVPDQAAAPRQTPSASLTATEALHTRSFWVLRSVLGLQGAAGISMVTLSVTAIVGFAFGTFFSVSAPLAIDCFGAAHFGAVYGLVFTVYGFLAGLAGPALSGHMLDLSGGGFKPVFAYLGVSCLLSGGLIHLVNLPAWRARVH